MVYFPTRKCYQAVKIVFLLVLVITVLALFEQWRGGKRNTGAMYTDPLEAEYERQILEDEARIIPGLGEGGVAAHLTGEEKRLGEESEKKLAINVYLSDRIAYNRTLKDFRNPACQRVVYDAELPSASVIIIFHNEPYSVVVRTIWSVVNSARRSNPWFQHANFVDQKTGRITNMGYPGQDPGSPFVYLKEVLLVDDNSTLPELKGKLSHYIRTRLPRGLVRLLRLPERVGLTQARMAGARAARAAALVFLDAHCEAVRDWLRPLLQRLVRRRGAVVTPLIDVIEQADLRYQPGAGADFEVGGFTFMGHFTWTEVPDREKKRRGSDIAPTWSPTMAGGLFAISRDYFWELGAYDEQMAGWGGENLEMSFRIWQCGGSLETIPCSRVGHVFRSFHPYGLPASSDTHGINTARMAEVWMDEYAELFYLHRPDLRNNPVIGDVTHRRVLREKLHCKSFQWYLDTVYPEKFVPVRDVYGYGRFKNEATQLCLDTLQREGDKVPLGAYPCYPALQATQYFSLSNKGELRDEIDCASVLHARIKAEERDKSLSRSVVMSTCHGKGRDQRWVRLRSGQLRHAASALCLTAPRAVADVRVTACDPADVRQIWTIDYTEDNNFKLNSDEEIMSEERERRISKLRGHRSNRISRSLTSYSEHSASHEPSAADSSTVRRHTHKSKHHKRRGRKAKRAGARRTKNKFLVRVARTLANGSEDHLEMDIHCRHRRLFPNNTFVRDLVTILNENNIKVINNGRVFERNKVTQLNAARAPRVLHKLDVAPPAQPPRQPPQPPATGGRVRGETKLSSELMATAASRQPAGDDAPGVGFGEAGHVEPRPVTPTAGRGAGGNKKLIIEDFVEVTSERARQAQKYRKHKRGRRPPPPSSTPPRPPQDHIFDGPRESAKDSAEGDWGPAESPLLDESAHRSGRAEHGADRIAKYRRDELKRTSSVALDSDEYHQRAPAADHVQDEGESREASRDYPKIIGDLLSGEGEASAEGAPRGVNQRDPGDSDVRHSREQATSFEPRYSLPLPRNSSAERVDKGAGRRSDDADGAPVKLVVRSNLTFDLADDLFSWKNKATDIVNEFLGELTIPSNDTEHLGGEGERPASSASESSAE